MRDDESGTSSQTHSTDKRGLDVGVDLDGVGKGSSAAAQELLMEVLMVPFLAPTNRTEPAA